MPIDDFVYWSKYIPILKAREQLVDMESNSYPNMKRDSMKEVHKRIKRIALPAELDKIHTFEELAQQLKGLKSGK